MLLAAKESAVTKKPRLRLTRRRSSSLRAVGSFHCAMSRLMFTSCGIQWLAQPARYFSHAHLYLKGTSWFTSVAPLITRLSAACTRRVLDSTERGAAGGSALASAGMGAAAMRGAAGVKSSSKFSIVFFSFGCPKVGWAHTTYSTFGGKACHLPRPLSRERERGVSPSAPPRLDRVSGDEGEHCPSSTAGHFLCALPGRVAEPPRWLGSA